MTDDALSEPVADAAADRRAASRTTWVSVWVNLVLTALQVAVGILAKSQALVADGLHSLSDLASDAVVLIAQRHAHKAADHDHPYGHQRFENAASLVLGLLMAAVGVGLLWGAVQRLEDPGAVPPVHPAALAMAVATLMIKEGLFRYMLRVGERLKSSLLVANAWHARSDAASSLVVALGIAGSLAGWPLLDAVAALVVGLMIVRTGWGFGWNALHDLTDRAADAGEVAAIRATLAATPGVMDVHDVRTRKMGDWILVDVHLEVDAELTVEAGHAIAVDARDRTMRDHRVLDVLTHVDPHRRVDADHAGGLTAATAAAPAQDPASADPRPAP
jgi:cation diffusion facilitator family transporter